ncbi:hypothetical protein [Nonomuraea dietziae]
MDLLSHLIPLAVAALNLATALITRETAIRRRRPDHNQEYKDDDSGRA